jgi:hypothetical protein
VQGLSTVVCQPCCDLIRFDLSILFPPRLIPLPLALSPLLPAAAPQPDRCAPRRSEGSSGTSYCGEIVIAACRVVLAVDHVRVPISARRETFDSAYERSR